MAELTRDNVQLIVNELWQQPTERFEETIVAKLPAPSFVLPRSRKCPVARPLTKWEQFAKEKGIKKAKKDKKMFDEELDVRTHHHISMGISLSIRILIEFCFFRSRNGCQRTVSSEHKLNGRRIGCSRCHRMLIQWRINLLRRIR